MSKKKRYDNINQDLSTILKTYPYIELSNIESFVPVYFPIALVEIDTVEESFEDFEVIELTVLKLVSLGITNSHEISQYLAIDEKYVHRMLKLLIGYGHIKDKKITEIGLRSLQTEQKIEKKAGKQIFQVNALNGTIMKLEDIISERQLDDKEQTKFRVAHMMNMGKVKTQELIDQLKSGDNYHNFRKSGQNEIINLIDIRDVHLKEKQYAYSYVLKLNGYEPIVLSKRYNIYKKNLDERYKWVPLSVKDTSLRQYLNLSESIPSTTNLELDIINQTMQLLHSKTENSTHDELKKMYMESCFEWYPFVASECRYKHLENGCEFIVVESSFSAYNRRVFEILKSFGKIGVYVYSRDNFYGNIVMIRPNSNLLDEVSQLLIKKISDFGDKPIRETLDEYFELSDRTNIIDEMYTVLSQYTHNEKES